MSDNQANSPVPWHGGRHSLEEPLPAISTLVGGPEELRAGIARLGVGFTRGALDDMDPDQLQRAMRADTFALPEIADRVGYWGEDHVAYWLSGLGDYLALRSLIPDCDGPPVVLDFGCASGRAARHFVASDIEYRVLGADVNARNIGWIRKHLQAPSLWAFQSTVYPPLPLPEASVDFAYALSVFTHIDEFEESWLLELRRVLRPGGKAFLTFHSERTWEQLTNPDHFMRNRMLKAGYVIGGTRRAVEPAAFGASMPHGRVVLRDPEAPYRFMNSFHTIDHVRQSWGRFFDVERFVECAHGQHQDAVILERPSR